MEEFLGRKKLGEAVKRDDEDRTGDGLRERDEKLVTGRPLGTDEDDRAGERNFRKRPHVSRRNRRQAAATDAKALRFRAARSGSALARDQTTSGAPKARARAPRTREPPPARRVSRRRRPQGPSGRAFHAAHEDRGLEMRDEAAGRRTQPAPGGPRSRFSFPSRRRPPPGPRPEAPERPVRGPRGTTIEAPRLRWPREASPPPSPPRCGISVRRRPCRAAGRPPTTRRFRGRTAARRDGGVRYPRRRVRKARHRPTIPSLAAAARVERLSGEPSSATRMRRILTFPPSRSPPAWRRRAPPSRRRGAAPRPVH